MKLRVSPTVVRWLVASAAVLTLTGVAIGLDTGTATVRTHRVEFEISEWPASGAAGWTDASGYSYTVPLGTFSITGPATSAWVTVDTPEVSCTLLVDGQAVDTATATDQPGTCRWARR